MRFGQVQKYRDTAARQGLVARLYISLLGTTSLFALNCYLLMRKTLKTNVDRASWVLDAGCGKGDFAFSLTSFYPDSQILGVDLSQAKTDEFARYSDNIEVCNQLKKRLNVSNITFEHGDLLDYGSDGEFDLIVCIHVLEHIPDNHLVVANLARILKPGGVLYIQMPAKSDLEIAFLNDALAERKRWETIEHISLLSLEELEGSVSNAGLDIVKSEAECGLFLTLAWQAREALVEKKYMVWGALMLPILKVCIFLHRGLIATVPVNYQKFSRWWLNADKFTEGNLEILAKKPPCQTK